MTRDRRIRLAGTAMLASVVAFLGLVAAAMASYPGGSWLDVHAQGHDFARNFLCDLLGPVAINGTPNPVASFAMISGMVILALGLGVTWWSVAALSTPGPLRLALQILGTVSVLGLLAVPLTPPTVSYRLHAAAIFGGGVPAIVTWTLAITALLRRPSTRWLGGLGVMAVLSSLVGFGLYASEYFFGGSPSLLLPLSHRLATALFLGWLVAVAIHVRGVGVISGSDAPSGKSPG